MSDNQDPVNDPFTQAREAFTQLGLDQKAAFLAQETVNTAVGAVRCLVDVISAECADLFDSSPDAAEESAEAEPTA